MDQQLLDLRQVVYDSAGKFTEAQQACLAVADLTAKQPAEVLKQAAENCLLAAKPYKEALREFRRYLLEVKPSDEIAEEFDRIEQLGSHG